MIAPKREHFELSKSLNPMNTDRLTELRARLVEQQMIHVQT
jgi:hypothetical protein